MKGVVCTEIQRENKILNVLTDKRPFLLYTIHAEHNWVTHNNAHTHNATHIDTDIDTHTDSQCMLSK